MLEIIDLHVETEDKKILKGLNLEIKKGEIHALMGPNGSGKSTLAHVLAGHQKYKITKGKIIFEGSDITKLSPDKRSKLGIFLSFQHPKEIEGVSLLKFLKTIKDKVDGKKSLTSKFKKSIEDKTSALKIDDSFISRNLNHNFSGGEKKKSEMIQLLTIEPKLSILDEIDSGLDIDSLKLIANSIKDYLKQNKNKSALIISHYKRIFEYLKPNKVSIIIDGKIAKEGGPSLIDKLEKTGYDSIKKVQDS